MARREKIPLLFHLPWYKVEECCREQTMAEISGWGVRKLVAPQYFWQQCGAALLQQMNALAARHGIVFAAAHGLLLLQAGPDVLRFVPALNITDRDIAEGLARLRLALAGLR